jgi:hypothetical protein
VLVRFFHFTLKLVKTKKIISMCAKISSKAKSEKTSGTKTVFQPGKVHPSVSILLPVNKKYPHFKQAEQKLKSLIKEAEMIIRDEVSEEMAAPLITKLQETALSIDFTHLSESLAIYVSSEFQRVIHLPIAVDEKMVVGRTFELRDLFYAAKTNFHYYFLTISENKVTVFLGYGNQLQDQHYDKMPFGMNDVPGEGYSRAQSFSSNSTSKNVSDENSHRENLMEKYLRDIDNELTGLLKQTKIPVIIGGVQKEIAGFNALTKNKEAIIGTIEGNFDYLNEKEIYNKIESILQAKLKNDEKNSLILLDEAISSKTFASGVHDVWRAVMEKRGRLLLVEKDYRVSGKQGKDKFTLITHNVDTTNTKNIADVVDDIIEYTFECGGDVAFVENGALSEHGGIALVTYYNIGENINQNLNKNAL